MNKIIISWTVAVVLTFFLTTLQHQAYAIEKNSKLEQMTVTSSRVEMPLRRVGSPISVLTSDQIEGKGYTTVAQVLRSLPGIGVSNSGGPGKQTTIRVRGEQGFRTKVLIDGIDVTDPTGTQAQPQIQHLLTADIDRIEVLRGPQGMMYGADAGGVINIITKKADQLVQGGVSKDVGRYNSKQVAANIRGQMQSFDYSLAVSDLSTDGFNARDDDRSEDNDGYDNTTWGVSLGYDFTQNIRVQAVARDIEGDSEFDNCFDNSFSPSNACDNEYKQNNYKVDVIYNKDQWEHKVSYAFAKTQRASIVNNVDKSFDTNGELKQIQYLGAYNVDDAAKLVYGVDLQEDFIESSNTPSERDQTGIYIEWQGNVSDSFFYTAGLRHDDNDDYGTYTSYRLTSAYLIPLSGDNELKLKTSHSTGFRAPSLFEIAFNASNPNPTAITALEQETSEGFDLGAEFYLANGAYLEMIYFTQEIKDEIIYDGSTNTYIQDNGSSESEGVEIAFNALLTEVVTLNGNYTYNNTEDSKNLQRIRRPKHIINLGLTAIVMNEKLTINANLRHVADSVDRVFDANFAAVRVNLEDYEVLDLNVSYTVTDKFEVYVRGENILNEKYQEITNFNTSGAATYAGLRYHF